MSRSGDLDARGRTLRLRVDAAGALAALRAGVLGGRGPGAGDAEVARHTRGRRALAGRPVTERLEETARRTEAFRSSGR